MSLAGYFNLLKLRSTKFIPHLQQIFCCICVETLIFLCLIWLASLQFLVFGVCVWCTSMCTCVCPGYMYCGICVWNSRSTSWCLPLFHLKLLRQGFSLNLQLWFLLDLWSRKPPESTCVVVHPRLPPAKCWNYFYTHKPSSLHSTFTNWATSLRPSSTRIP